MRPDVKFSLIGAVAASAGILASQPLLSSLEDPECPDGYTQVYEKRFRDSAVVCLPDGFDDVKELETACGAIGKAAIMVIDNETVRLECGTK